jgi:hypothetical protein
MLQVAEHVCDGGQYILLYVDGEECFKGLFG